MAYSGYKDAAELAYDANRVRLRTEGRIALARLLNEAMNEMTVEFKAALARGELLELDGSPEEMERYLFAAVQRRQEDQSAISAKK